MKLRDPLAPTTLGGELAVALTLAPVWSLEIAARFGNIAGVAQTLIASFGCTALTLGAVAVVVRPRRATPTGPQLVGVAALLSSGPIAVVGAWLRDKTHHRALGGVTFAFVAWALVVLGFLVARRGLADELVPPRARSSLRWALVTLTLASAAVAFRPLLPELGGVGSPSGRLLGQDLGMGVGLTAVAVALPRLKLSPRAARFSAAAWALAVTASVSMLVASMPLRAMLAGHAPVALGALGVLQSAGHSSQIPSIVDVSLH